MPYTIRSIHANQQRPDTPETVARRYIERDASAKVCAELADETITPDNFHDVSSRSSERQAELVNRMLVRWNPHGGAVTMIEGRAVQVGKPIRVRQNPSRPAWGWHNVCTVVFLDTGESRSMTATQINKAAKGA